MLASLESILPLFLMMGLGFVARKTVLDTALLPGLNAFVYYFAAPALLFRASSEIKITEILYWPGIGAFLLGTVFSALAVWLTCRAFFGDQSRPLLTMKVVGSVFANYAYMGIPLSFAVLGSDAYGATLCIILIGNIVVIVGGQIVLEALSRDSFNVRTVIGIMDRALLRNPIFVSIALGLLFSVNLWSLPTVFNQTLDMLSPAAVPVALFCIGASLKLTKKQFDFAEISWLVCAKLVVHPLLTFFAFYLVGLHGSEWQLVAVLLSALPTGALAHVVALKYDVYESQTAQVIVLSTLLSLGSLVVWMSFIR